MIKNGTSHQLSIYYVGRVNLTIFLIRNVKWQLLQFFMNPEGRCLSLFIVVIVV
jgi:hypothetical protein